VISLTYTDQARSIIAGFGSNTYTTRDVQDALDGYVNTSQTLKTLEKWGEIERIGRSGTGKRTLSTWRTIKLSDVCDKKPTASASKTGYNRNAVNPMSDAERAQHQCALRLQAALDAMTRRNREACHA
jgi:hypothetical protein